MTNKAKIKEESKRSKRNKVLDGEDRSEHGNDESEQNSTPLGRTRTDLKTATTDLSARREKETPR